jgi:hypothetical protein
MQVPTRLLAAGHVAATDTPLGDTTTVMAIFVHLQIYSLTILFNSLESNQNH